MINPDTHFRAFIAISGKADTCGMSSVAVRFSDEAPIAGEEQVICTRAKGVSRELTRCDISSNISEEIYKHGITRGLYEFQVWSANQPQTIFSAA